MITEDAYRRFEALGKLLLHEGHITPMGLRQFYDVLADERIQGEREEER